MFVVSAHVGKNNAHRYITLDGDRVSSHPQLRNAEQMEQKDDALDLMIRVGKLTPKQLTQALKLEKDFLGVVSVRVDRFAERKGDLRHAESVKSLTIRIS